MKKKIMILILIALTITININNYLMHKKEIKNAEIQNKNNNIQNKLNSNLAMMLETSTGSGKYEKTTLTSWPTDGYLFNSTLSGCENGGKITYNDEKNKVILKGNISDKCYVYFDKYVLPKITSITTSNITPTSIYVTLKTQKGTNTTTKYYYSISTNNNDTSFIESTSSTYNFTNLQPQTTYYIKAYVKDSNNRKSKIKETSATTTIYKWARYKYVTKTVTIPEKYELTEIQHDSQEDIYRKTTNNSYIHSLSLSVYLFDTYTFVDGEISINEVESKDITVSYGSSDSGTKNVTTKYFCPGTYCRKRFYSAKSFNYDGWFAPPSSDATSHITITVGPPFTEYELNYTAEKEETVTEKQFVNYVTSTDPNAYPNAGDVGNYYYERV